MVEGGARPRAEIYPELIDTRAGDRLKAGTNIRKVTGTLRSQERPKLKSSLLSLSIDAVTSMNGRYEALKTFSGETKGETAAAVRDRHFVTRARQNRLSPLAHPLSWTPCDLSEPYCTLLFNV
jgi:hypothetical protein